MWLLVLICVSTAGGVPINQTQEATSPTTAGGVPINQTQEATSPTTAGGVPIIQTQEATSPTTVGGPFLNENMTSPTPGVVSIRPDPQQLASPETLMELQEVAAVKEGDILIPEDRNAVPTLWSEATIPFTISKELAARESNIHDAFNMISASTCIRFKPHTTEFNYVKFKNGKGCASSVGCQGGAQTLYYSQSCSVGNLCHEIIHALGLHHEHTRKDRDQYVTIHWDRIMKGKQGNFKVKRGDTQNLPYDFDSIMHYGENFFSRDGSPTMLPKNTGVQIGQRSRLSKLDIERLNKLYHCDERMKRDATGS